MELDRCSRTISCFGIGANSLGRGKKVNKRNPSTPSSPKGCAKKDPSNLIRKDPAIMKTYNVPSRFATSELNEERRILHPNRLLCTHMNRDVASEMELRYSATLSEFDNMRGIGAHGTLPPARLAAFIFPPKTREKRKSICTEGRLRILL